MVMEQENEEFIRCVKAAIANRMAEAAIEHRCELMQLSAAAYESMYGDKDIIF